MFYCMGQCVSMPRLLWRTLMVMKVDSRLQRVCDAASVYFRAVLTLAQWQDATPGAVAGAGPCDSLVASHHHEPWLACERHIVAHGEVIAGF